mgnify:CR=1 FL=1
MICLTLFWNFLMIGTLSFGGGYGMISLVREVVLGHGWLTESEFLSFIAELSAGTGNGLSVRMKGFEDKELPVGREKMKTLKQMLKIG